MAFVMKIQMGDILQKKSLRNTYINGKVMGYAFEVKLGYYRGLYLSCFESYELIVDGTAVEEEMISFNLNDKSFVISELKYLSAEFWNIVEPATIQVFQPEGLKLGDHEIEMKLMMRSPYLPVPGSNEPHTYVPIDSCDKQVLSLSC